MLRQSKVVQLMRDPKKVAEHTSEMLKHLSAVSQMQRRGSATSVVIELSKEAGLSSQEAILETDGLSICTPDCEIE
jgi:hypothetical protein